MATQVHLDKMAIKMERKREFSSFQLLMLCHMSAAVCYVSVAFWVVRSICPAVHTELLKAETYLLNPYISQGVLGLREVWGLRGNYLLTRTVWYTIARNAQFIIVLLMFSQAVLYRYVHRTLCTCTMYRYRYCALYSTNALHRPVEAMFSLNRKIY